MASTRQRPSLWSTENSDGDADDDFLPVQRFGHPFGMVPHVRVEHGSNESEDHLMHPPPFPPPPPPRRILRTSVSASIPDSDMLMACVTGFRDLKLQMRQMLYDVVTCSSNNLIRQPPSSQNDIYFDSLLESRTVSDLYRQVGPGENKDEVLQRIYRWPRELTLYEICSELGTNAHLEELRSCAQKALSVAIFNSESPPTIMQVCSLVRAGADPTRQHLSRLWVSGGTESSLREVQLKLPRAGTPIPEGFPLHWICQILVRPGHTLANAKRYLDLANWLCEFAPLTLVTGAGLIGGAESKTPLEIAVDGYCYAKQIEDNAMEDNNTPEGVAAATSIPRPDKKSLISLIDILATHLRTALHRYPTSCMARLWAQNLDGRSFRTALRWAGEALTEDSDPAEHGQAIQGLQLMMQTGNTNAAGKDIANPEHFQPWIGQIEAAASSCLGDLQHASARRQALTTMVGAVQSDIQGSNLQDLQIRYEEEKAQRVKERSEFEAKIDELEGQLAEATKRAEDLELQKAELMKNFSARMVGGGPLPHPNSGVAPNLVGDFGSNNNNNKNSGAQGPTSSSTSMDLEPGTLSTLPHEQAVVEGIRRRRLVDHILAMNASNPTPSSSSSLPKEVTEGIRAMATSLCAAVERLAEDLYEDKCHFLYELVQNAEDAHGRARRPDVPAKQQQEETFLQFKLGSTASCPSYFLAISNEAGFTDRDLEAICDISRSSKSRSRLGEGATSVGCKGIGFKSVFTVSDRPCVLSGGFTFCFDTSGPLGKLGYVTPTWLDSEALQNVPEDARKAHENGLTVLFLPLRGDAGPDIGREMDELVEQGRPTMLFLQNLKRIDLQRDGRGKSIYCRSERESGQETIVVEELESSVSVKQDHFAYNVFKYREDNKGPTLTLAFPEIKSNEGPENPDNNNKDEAAAGGPESRRSESLFCTLPVRPVGFGFALQCEHFDLVANRGDFHHSSPANLLIRNTLPKAFAAACKSLPKVASQALQLVSNPIADTFWRPARQAIIEEMGAVSCVETEAGAKRPEEVLLPGQGLLLELSELVPGDLLFAATGRVFCHPASASEDRLLRKLGAQPFAAHHLCDCLTWTDDEEWVEGWIRTLWSQPGELPEAVRVTSAVYKYLASISRHEQGGPMHEGTLDIARRLPSLPIFPLLNGDCVALKDGKVFTTACSDFDCRWQDAWSQAGILRILPSQLVDALETGTLRFLHSLGVGPATARDLVVIALKLQIQGLSNNSPSVREGSTSVTVETRVSNDFRWASLGVLREAWLKRDPEPAEERMQEGTVSWALYDALSTASLVSNWKEAHQFVSTALGSLVRLPTHRGSAATEAPSALVCPTLLGVKSCLGEDLSARVYSFLYPDDIIVESTPHNIAEAPPLISASTRSAAYLCDALAWEAFFVDGLGVQMLSPGDPRVARPPPDITLQIGQYLGSTGEDNFWRVLHTVPEPVFKYCCEKLGRGAVVEWLGQAPCRCHLALRDLFLKNGFSTLAVGTYLEQVDRQLDIPELFYPGRRGPLLLKLFSDMGGRTGLAGNNDPERRIEDYAELLKAISPRCSEIMTYAGIYKAISSQEETLLLSHSASSGGSQGRPHHLSPNLEATLRTMIFHPDTSEFHRSSECIWTSPTSRLLCLSSSHMILKDCYNPLGLGLESYFRRRRVAEGTNTANEFENMYAAMCIAAEGFARAWALDPARQGNVEVALDTTFSARPMKTFVSGLNYMGEIWTALLEIFRGLAALPEEEQAALKSSSGNLDIILVPNRCPRGGPPQIISMQAVAIHHNGVLFRRMPVRQAFWEVGQDLAHHPAGEWALSNYYPPDLKDFFVRVLKVREVMTAAALQELAREQQQRERPTGRGLAAGRRGFGAQRLLSELGLPAEVMQGAGGVGQDVGDQQDLAQAMRRVLNSLRGDASDSDDSDDAPVGNSTLVLPALPARSVHCPPTREIRLNRFHPSERSYQGPRTQFFILDEALNGASDRLLLEQLNSARVQRMVQHLHKLCSVFGIPDETGFGIILDRNAGGLFQEDCGHLCSTRFPPLFPASMAEDARRSDDEALYYFVEFCHVLTHRALGSNHSNRFLQLMCQGFHSKYHDRFLQLRTPGGSDPSRSSNQAPDRDRGHDRDRDRDRDQGRNVRSGERDRTRDRDGRRQRRSRSRSRRGRHH